MTSYLNTLQTTREQAEAAAEFPLVTLRFLRNYTIEKIEPFLQQNFYAVHLKPVVHFGGYNTAQQEILGEIQSDSKEIIVLTLLLDQLDPDYNQPEWDSVAVRRYLTELLSSLAARTTATVVVNNFFLPLYPALENDALTLKIAALNEEISRFVADHHGQFRLVDWNRLLCQVGAEQAFDRRNWLMFADPFRPAFLSAYAGEIFRIVRALSGKAKKCLVLDCDNTLWGGIIGEDGLAGIRLDRNTYPGKVYYEFQKTVLNLAQRGVMIALCSKNNPADVWEVLDHHPYCLLKKNHLSAFRINWEDKASNLKSLAEKLNIGLDSFVFVDDSPSECELIRRLCPEVTVLTVPQKLAEYPQLLQKDGWFDVLAVSEEDLRRNALYQEEQARRSQREQSISLTDYLASLKTEITVGPATAEQVARIAQLTQKTNQFNLTTRRYGEAEIKKFMANEDYFVGWMKVKDCFGDLGLTGVVIVRREAATAVIDDFLLSCRVLGRQLEQAFLQQVCSFLEQAWSIHCWRAAYLPTAKNQQVADFWSKLGFRKIGGSDGQSEYEVDAGQQQWASLAHLQVTWQPRQ